MRKIVAGAVVLLVMQVVALAVLVYAGAYDVSATRPHSRAGEFLLRTIQARSVERRATSVAPHTIPAEAVPPRGAAAYHAMCATCHGAPGVARSEIGSGMNPRPPDLSQIAPRWSDRELFWIVKHGIRLAGMPAFGPTHHDDELWDIVALVRALPTLGARDYARLTASGQAHRHDALSASPRTEPPSHRDERSEPRTEAEPSPTAVRD